MVSLHTKRGVREGGVINVASPGGSLATLAVVVVTAASNDMQRVVVFSFKLIGAFRPTAQNTKE